MPRYVSPSRERSLSPERSPSRTSRGRRSYTDGVYTPSPSESPSRSPSRSPSQSRSRSRRRRSSRGRSARSFSSDAYSHSYTDTSDSLGRSRSRSRSTVRTGSRGKSRGARERLSSILDTSNSTGQEKAENVVKTSLVMLGAIGAASLAAHKFWPKGITYGDPDDWEVAHEKKKEEDKKKLKGKLKEGRDAVEGAGSGSGGGGGRDDPERRRYIRDRYKQRPALPRSMDGEDGARFWERRERVVSRNSRAGAYAPDEEDGYDPRERRQVEPAPQHRRLEAAPPHDERRHADAPPPRRVEAPPPPPVPSAPRSYADSAPLVVPAGASYREGRDGNRGRYYIDRDVIVVPSSSEKQYVIQRDAPPGQRLRERERDGPYYR